MVTNTNGPRTNRRIIEKVDVPFNERNRLSFLIDRGVFVTSHWLTSEFEFCQRDKAVDNVYLAVIYCYQHSLVNIETIFESYLDA